MNSYIPLFETWWLFRNLDVFRWLSLVSHNYFSLVLVLEVNFPFPEITDSNSLWFHPNCSTLFFKSTASILNFHLLLNDWLNFCDIPLHCTWLILGIAIPPLHRDLSLNYLGNRHLIHLISKSIWMIILFIDRVRIQNDSGNLITKRPPQSSSALFCVGGTIDLLIL